VPFAELHLGRAIELAPALNGPLVDRALFVRGRIAADRADAAGVSRALAQLGNAEQRGVHQTSDSGWS
jgi:hypothetical protein